MGKKNKISSNTRIGISTNERVKKSDTSKYLPTSRLSPIQYLSNLRATVLPEHYAELISDIEKYPYSMTNLLSSKRRRKAKDIKSQHLYYLNFESEFYWAKNIFLRNTKAINRFLELSNLYSKKLLTGQIDNAREILETIDGEFGFSLWLVKNKIALLQLSEGLESQKKYTQVIKNELKNGSLPSFITHWVSVRNEQQTSANRYLLQIDSMLNRLDPISQHGYREFCKYHLSGSSVLDPEEFIQVLRLEYSSSIIDYYEAFVNLIKILVIDKDATHIRKVTFLLKDQKFNISDERLDIVRDILALDATKHQKVTVPNSVFPFDLFLKGQNMEALKVMEKTAKNFPDDAIAIMLEAYFIGLDDQLLLRGFQSKDTGRNLRETLIFYLSEVVRIGFINASKEYAELNKILLNYSSFSWTSAISILLQKETLIFSDLDSACALYALKFPSVHPFLLDCFTSGDLSTRYMNLCSVQARTSFCAKYYVSIQENILLEDSEDIMPVCIFYGNSVIKYKERHHKETIELAKKLIESKNTYFVRRGYGLISHSYLQLGELRSACEITAYCFVNERPYFPFLPLRQIVDLIKVGSDEWERVDDLVDFAIILDASVKNVDKKYETERRFAYEDFLTEHNITRPSQLITKLSHFDHKKIVYYLRYLCIESIMDTSSSFEEGSQEVGEERLAICKILLDVDVVNQDIYKLEINELVRKQLIASRRVEVDQSRIYVDIASIKEWAIAEVKENFDRYISYKRYGIGTFSVAQDGLEISSRINSALESNIAVPQNEATDLLGFMIEEVLEAYLSDDFGLDRFLSTRIRHGILEGHLRRPMQNNNLITKRQSKNGPYLKNELWLNKIGPGHKDVIRIYEKAFSKFSESFDELIAELTNDWLQIKRDTKPKGLFNFSISEDDTLKIAEYINLDTTIQEFIDIVIVAFENTLIVLLINIREKLNDVAKSKAKGLLISLQEVTSKYPTNVSLELQNSISQGRIDLQTQFNKVIDWFVPSASGDSTPFLLEDAIVVAEAIVKETNPLFQIEIDSDDNTAIPIHGQLPIFVDIFVNIFENIVKRSGLEFPQAKISIWADNANPELTVVYFKISNPLGCDIDRELLKSELLRKKYLLENESYSHYLATEGNSGLFKVHKSVKHFKPIGFDETSTMDFGIEDDCYQITISVPFRIFALEED